MLFVFFSVDFPSESCDYDAELSSVHSYEEKHSIDDATEGQDVIRKRKGSLLR